MSDVNHTQLMAPPGSPTQARQRIAASCLNAFITVCDPQPGSNGPIVAVKDLIDVAGVPTTNGGPTAAVHTPKRDAPVVAMLREIRADIIGKTNLYEWAFGVSSENRNHGPVHNPHDLDRSAGGSSSGSAAAVAGGLCDWALGTDTSGSVRIPASLCGVVGFKPTHGLLPIAGVTPLARSHDTLGVLAHTVDEAWSAVQALGVPGEFSPRRERPRLAAPRGWVTGLDETTLSAWGRVAAGLDEIHYPRRELLFELATAVQAYEAYQIHAAPLQEHPDYYRPEVRERVMVGAHVSRGVYESAKRTLSELAADADRVLATVDALVLPTTACVAPRLSDPTPREPLTRFTRPFSATGQPAFSMPLPYTTLPVGLQLVGRRNHDVELAGIAAAVASSLDQRRGL